MAVPKYQKRKAVNELVGWKNINTDVDFVAIGSETRSINNNTRVICNHSFLLICLEKQLFKFHYTGEVVLLEEVEIENLEGYYFNILRIIHELQVSTFKGFCEDLLNLVHPIYGFVFNDSFYSIDENKNFFLNNAIHDITTCSGFCVKVIRGFLINNPEYLRISDWDINSFLNAPPGYRDYMNQVLINFAILNGLNDLDQLIALGELKRITPIELLISAYYTDLPIIKESIDWLLDTIDTKIQEVA